MSDDLRRRGLIGHASAVEWASSVAFPEVPTTHYEIDEDGSAVRTPAALMRDPIPEGGVGVIDPERARA